MRLLFGGAVLLWVALGGGLVLARGATRTAATAKATRTSMVPSPKPSPGAQETVDDLPVDAEPLPEPEPEPSPTPLTEDEAWDKQVRDGVSTLFRVRRPAWPGTFVGLRTAWSLGEALVPQLSGDSRAVLSQLGPWFGIELGVVRPLGRWGGGFSIDVAPSMPIDSTFLSGTVKRILVSANVIHVPDYRSRWVFGFVPYAWLGMQPIGQRFTYLEGLGLRVGYHLRPKRSTWDHWEGLVYLHWDRYTSVGTPVSSQAVYSYLGPERISQCFMGWLGIQYTFSAKGEQL